MGFCTSCGAAGAAGAAFCSKCGKKMGGGGGSGARTSTSSTTTTHRTAPDGSRITTTKRTVQLPSGETETSFETTTVKEVPATGDGEASTRGNAPPSGERCAACHDVLEFGKFTRALGRCYHAVCFKCAECGAALGKNFYESGGRAVCKQHAAATPVDSAAVAAAAAAPNAPSSGFTCRRCSSDIRGAVVSVLGGRYHPDCVRCFVCNEKLGGGGGAGAKPIYVNGENAACYEHAHVKTDQRRVESADDADDSRYALPGEQLVSRQVKTETRGDGTVVEVTEETYRDAKGNERTTKRTKTTRDA